MMNRQEWEHLFLNSGRDWREKTAIVEREVRALLAKLPEGAALPTRDFAAMLFDGLEGKALGDGVTRLLRLAKHVPGLAYGVPEPVERYGRTYTANRYYWSRSGTKAPPSPPPAAKAASKATLHEVLAQLEIIGRNSEAIFSQLADLRQRVAQLEVKQQ